MEKTVTLEKITERFKDGQTIMIGGFLGGGDPVAMIEAIVKKGVKDLTLIANDSGFHDRMGIGALVVNRQVKKLIVSHVGTNRETGRQMNAGEMEVILTPQGTLAERIRCGGVGLGGFLTPTGVGTVVEEGKRKINIDGRDFLLELPLKAEMALIHAWKADKYGNLVYRKSARNFNPLMAMAADVVVASVEQIVEVGELDPDEAVTPGVLVDFIVKV